MRITNNMIVANTKANINSNKLLVDKYNTQMTTQKKISKASEDPVVAIRSLRMSTTLSHLDQYLDNNISEVNSWLDITQTALVNMKDILTDIRTQCVNGSTDTLTADDRNTILTQLQALADQVYTEGNADYAGRTVFTGYRTSSMLTFTENEADTTYTIDQSFTYQDLTEHRYYYGSVEVPTSTDEGECTTEVGTVTYDRIRLAYDGIDSLDSISYTTSDGTTTDLDVTVYDSEEDWLAASSTKELGDDEVIFIKSTGELIFGSEISSTLSQGKADINVTYTKTGFEEGEVRPEYYYDCTMSTPELAEPVTYTKEDQGIEFTISTGITIVANTQASDVFDTSIARDVDELIDVVSAAVTANDKVDEITAMMAEEKYASDEDQAILQTYLDAAQKEADYANDNLQKTYEQYITNFDNYLEDVNIAITNIGSTQQRLDLTQNRVESQITTVEELKTNNEDRDISDIIIDYYAAYYAYTASLTAASKVGEQTLLNYL